MLLVRVRGGVEGAAGGVAEEEEEEGDEDAGSGADVEGHAPSITRTELSADDVAEGGADRYGHIEDGEDASAALDGEEVGEISGRDRNERGFSDADHRMADEHGRVVAGKGGHQGGERPDDGAKDDDVAAGVAVSEPTRRRAGDHVADAEGGGEETDLGVECVELVLHQRLHGGED